MYHTNVIWGVIIGKTGQRYIYIYVIKEGMKNVTKWIYLYITWEKNEKCLAASERFSLYIKVVQHY